MPVEKVDGKAQKKAIKQFGYILSVILIVVTVAGVYFRWVISPWLYLVTMVILTGALWIPGLIKPLYLLFGKYIIKPESQSDAAEPEDSTDTFNKN